MSDDMIDMLMWEMGDSDGLPPAAAAPAASQLVIRPASTVDLDDAPPELWDPHTCWAPTDLGQLHAHRCGYQLPPPPSAAVELARQVMGAPALTHRKLRSPRTHCTAAESVWRAERCNPQAAVRSLKAAFARLCGQHTTGWDDSTTNQHFERWCSHAPRPALRRSPPPV